MDKFKKGDLVKVVKPFPSSWHNAHLFPVGSEHTVTGLPYFGGGVYTNTVPNLWYYNEFFALSQESTVDDLKRVVDNLRRQGYAVEVRVTEKVTVEKETVL